MAISAGSRGRTHHRASRHTVVSLAVLAAILLVVPYFLPFWRFDLFAPQYPAGLSLVAGFSGIAGDVREVNILNRFIGMGDLTEAARLELALAPYGVLGAALAALAVVLLAPPRVAWLAVLVALALPIGFLLDLQYWLARFGRDLDPRAPFRVAPFTPPILGPGQVGQFRTLATPMVGFWVSLASAVLFGVTARLRHRGVRPRPPSRRRVLRPSHQPRRPTRRGGAEIGAVLLTAILGAAAPRAVAGGEPSAEPGGGARVVVRPGQDVAASLAGAPAGAEVVLAAGVHRGPLRVDRTVALRGEAGAVLRGAGRGTVLTVAAPGAVVRDLGVEGGGADPVAGDAGVRVEADGVVLEGLEIRDVFIGIEARRAEGTEIRGCTVRGRTGLPLGMRGDGIRLWEVKGARVEGNRLLGVRDVLVWFTTGSVLAGNEAVGSRYGVHLMYADGNRVEDNVFRDPVVGVFVMYSRDVTLRGNRVTGAAGPAGVGLGFKESDGIVATGNRVVACTTGIYLDGTPRKVGGSARFEGNLLAYDDVGARLHGQPAGAVFTRNSFHETGTPVVVDSAGEARGTVFVGNHWGDYAGFDLDGDGIGDVPYELRSTTGALRDRRPTLQFFTGTPAARLLDLLGAAFPMFGPRPVLKDERPLVGSPIPRAARAVERGEWGDDPRPRAPQVLRGPCGPRRDRPGRGAG
ncbi:nitrous oxide reductase family maturation protein NosD [Myxococcota bacterium]|nr:nitrous oxide reductase family maturation protein NosD [Myxococcota bacterium]